MGVHISDVTKYVTKFLTLSKNSHFAFVALFQIHDVFGDGKLSTIMEFSTIMDSTMMEFDCIGVPGPPLAPMISYVLSQFWRRLAQKPGTAEILR